MLYGTSKRTKLKLAEGKIIINIRSEIKQRTEKQQKILTKL